MTQVLPRPSIRPHLRLRRRPLPYWLVATLVALGTAALVGRLVGDAAAERARWRATTPAVVLRHHVDAGSPLTDEDVRVRLLPSALTPDGALRSLPTGAVAAVDLSGGEVLLGHRLLGRGPSAVAARLPRDTRGIAVPAADGLPLRLGDRVDLLATFDADASTGGPPTFAVARDAMIVHVGPDAVTVAVANGSAPKVAYALAAGVVTVVLSARTTSR